MSSVQASAAVAMVDQSGAAAQVGPRSAEQRGPSVTPAEKVIVSSSTVQRSDESARSSMADSAKLRERLERVVDDLNSMIKSGNRDLSFGVDHVADRFIVTVKNANNGDVIRQIPGEDVLRIAHRMEALKGMLFEDLF